MGGDRDNLPLYRLYLYGRRCVGVPREQFLQAKFGLTPAETRLVLLLVKGESLESCAIALNIKYETARSALKSIFQKTGTHRQTELVLMVSNLLHSIPPYGG
jgi:DNA-binding CsgD family transcriptional regulator